MHADLECLYRELTDAKMPREKACRILSRAEELVDKISHSLRNEILMSEDSDDPEIVAVADGFAKNMESLCNPILTAPIKFACNYRYACRSLR